jgi:hypothetical protein
LKKINKVVGPACQRPTPAHGRVSRPARAVTPRWLGHRLPPHASVVGRPPRPLHAQRMQPPPRAPYPHAICPKEKPFPPLPAAAVELSPTSLCLSSHICSFITTPLSPLRRRTSRPTSYRPVSPTSLPSRCSQPRGKSTTGAAARALRHPPSSTTANSSLTGHLRLSPPPSPPPRAPPHPGVLHRPLYHR